jgi:tRNA threonylcarbamoyladenosine biosynthesis protein TsaB
MSFILSLETSTSVCSAALHEEGRLISFRETHVPQSHASALAVMIDELMKDKGLSFKQLGAVAIASGPGSYTGLRIGTSTAKGICFAARVPLIAVGTLDVMASQVDVPDDIIFLCPMIDARRMEVYCQVVRKDLSLVQPVEAKIIDDNSFVEILNAGVTAFFGDGTAKCKGIINHSNARFVEDIVPSASALGVLAYQKLIKDDFEDLTHFEPFYLKDFLIKKPV